jgi:hypothetical protein
MVLSSTNGMSGFGQTTRAGARKGRVVAEGDALELLRYGLDEAGQPAFAERLAAHQRGRLREIAAEHLERHHAVEVWEGPTCILRLRRRPT